MMKLLKSAVSVAILAIFLFILFVALTRAQSFDVVADGRASAVVKAALASDGGE